MYRLFKPVVLMTLNTGMRKGEILSLKWDQVDLEAKTITVLFSKSGKVRKIPINSILFEVLQGLKAKAISEYVFTCKRTKLPPGKIQNAWLTAIRKSGIIRCRFHDLRHTFASRLIANGVDIVTVKELLGHADIKMTMRYAHAAPESKVNAVATLVKGIRDESSHYLVTRPKTSDFGIGVTH